MAKDRIEKEIKERWDAIYREVPYTRLPWEKNRPDEELVRLVKSGQVPRGYALDICCGSGTQAIFLAKQGFNVVALDISPTVLEIAKKRAEEEGVKVDFLEGVSYDLKFRDETFDFIFDRGCFHHVPPEFREKYIAGIHRIIKNGGKYYLQAFSTRTGWRQENVFSLERIRDYFSKYFNILESKEILHREPDGGIVYLWSVFMEKKRARTLC